MKVFYKSWMHDHFNANIHPQKRLAKEAKLQETQAKSVAPGKKVKESAMASKTKSRGETAYFKVTCKVQGLQYWFL